MSKKATAAQRKFNQYPSETVKEKATALAAYIKSRRESAVYSTWDNSKTEEYTKTADRQLAKYNPGHKDNVWTPNKVSNVDTAPNSGNQTLNTFGDDCRGLKEGWHGIGGGYRDE